jgi:hypothetical protein
MLSIDCKALDRFKSQRFALKRGRKVKESTCFSCDPIKESKYSEKQYQNCIDKLHSAKATDEEIALFEEFNKKLEKSGI